MNRTAEGRDATSSAALPTATSAGGSTPPSPPPSSVGPPPPPDGDAEARSAGARWLAGLGTLLLLAGAAAFLAAHWDGLGLPARVAIVGSLTGAAVLGGHRLRDALPVVGGALFHLGAILIPIDVLGLALQLGASASVRTLAVGLSGVVVLPVLAVFGRSRLLGAVAIGMVPVAATGAALITGTSALLLNAVAAAALVVAATGRTRDAVDPTQRSGSAIAGDAPTSPATITDVLLVGWATSALALATSAAPLVVTAARSVFGDGGLIGTWVEAGWVHPRVEVVGLAGALIVAALIRRAFVEDSVRAVGAVVAAVVSSLAAVLLVTDVPRLAFLLAPGLVLSAVEVLAWQAPRSWTRTLAKIGEWVMGLVALGGSWLLLERAGLVPADRELAAGALALALAWALAAARREDVGRDRPGRDGDPSVPVHLGLVVAHLATALAVLQLPSVFDPGRRPGGSIGSTLDIPAGAGDGWWVLAVAGPSLVLVAGAALLSLTELVRERRAVSAGSGDGVVRARAMTALGAIAGLLVLALLREVPREVSTVVVFAAGVLLAAHAWAAARHARRGATAIAWGTAAVGTALTVGRSAELDAGALVAVLTLVGMIAVLALLAVAVERTPRASDLVVVALGIGGLVWQWGGLSEAGRSSLVSPTGAELMLVGSGFGAAGVVPALGVLVALGLVLIHDARPVTMVAVSLVAVRLVTAGGFALGLDGTSVALILGVVALLGVALLARGGVQVWLVAPATAASAGVALALVAELTSLRPVVLLVVAGALILAAVGTRTPWLGHVGGVVGTVGVWDLLDLRGIEALDAWIAPLALHLLVAGLLARRSGTASSSWVVEVPALLLLTSTALVERIATGSAVHGVVAGVVAVTAVVWGAWRRYAGPLVVGTVVVLVVVAIETLAVAVLVPTWIWLTIGGTVLFAAAALLERSGSPARVGRRIRAVLQERFQ